MFYILRILQAFKSQYLLKVYTISLLIILCSSIYAEDYKIKNGDTLLIAVIGQPDYTHSVQVRIDGKISYFGGDIQVAGKTTEEVNKIIGSYLQKQALVNNPVIMVSAATQENTVFVGGSVTTPGRYSISPESDIGLYRAIALAGGMTENADVYQVQLIRFHAQIMKDKSTISTKTNVETYDLSTNQNYQDVRVYSNDLVYIKQLSIIEVQGEVKAAGKLFIRGKISIPNALARAGGPTQEADLSALVKVDKIGAITEFDINEQFWKTTTHKKQDILLSDGDVLYIPNAYKVKPIYVTGYVRNPGAQRVRGPLTLQKAIALAGGLEKEANRKKFYIHRLDGTTEAHFAEAGVDNNLLYPGDILEVRKKFQINWGIISTISSTSIAIISLIISVTRN